MAQRTLSELVRGRRDRAAWAVSGLVWFAFGFVVGALVLSLFSGGAS